MELTPEELEVVRDEPRLLAKTRATRKLREHLEALKWALFPLVQGDHPNWVAPEGFEPANSQIARGENLDGTPYQYLDFPKYFTVPCHFTFRTLLWWGRGLCCCWILKGPDLDRYRHGLVAGVTEPDADLGVWFGGDPWDWDGFVPLASVPPEALEPLGFLKVGRRLPLTPERLTRDGLVAAGLDAFRALRPVVAREGAPAPPA